MNTATNDPATPWRTRSFRLLFGVWLGANVCTWVHEATAGWLMASMQATPRVVALLQAASMLPVFLLALPSGALADLTDRRRLLIGTYLLFGAVNLGLGAMLLAGYASPALLLAGAFALGATFAMRNPTYHALVQEIIPRQALASAIVWNGASMSASRVAGPALAGVIIAWSAPAYAYLASGVLSLILAVLLIRWRRRRAPASTLPSERFMAAIRLGLQFARQTPAMRAAVARGAAYYFFAVATLALLPVVVRDRLEAGAGTFTLLFALFGVGALAMPLCMEHLRKRLSGDGLIALATVLQAVAAAAFAVSGDTAVLALAAVASGFAWIAVGVALQVVAQLSLPAWVRGRGLAAVTMAFMAGSACGSIVWGELATRGSLALAFGAAALGSLASLGLRRWFPTSHLPEEDLTPSRHWPEPSVAMPIEDDEGPVIVTIEYHIDPDQADAFTELMQESRPLRLRGGAVSWALLRDSARPGRFIEQFVEESWIELLRHRDRVTMAERELRDRKFAFHVGAAAPVVTYLVAQDLTRRKRLAQLA